MSFNLSPSRGFDTSARARFTNKACRINKTAPLAIESASTAPGNGKVWTPEKLAEVKAYREKYGTRKTAEHYQVTEQRIRQLLPGEKPKAKGYSAFTHRPK